MDKKPLIVKWLAIGIILLFVGTCIIPANAQKTEQSQSTSRGTWLYVGGTGPENYTKIQDAIDNASEGDIVYVYNGTYYETISINITDFKLIGEGRDITVIKSNSSIAIKIKKDSVFIKGFSILTNGIGIYVSLYLKNIQIYNNNLSNSNYGIAIAEYNNFHRIENNVFYSNFYGISVHSFHIDGYCVIRNNTFVDNHWGIDLGGAYHEIQNNKFFSCKRGIEQHGGATTFSNNIFIGNEKGLISAFNENNIIGNHFEDNGIGLFGEGFLNNKINQNNFIQNRRHAIFSEESRSHGNNWNNNYWSGSISPFVCKIIFGNVQTRIRSIFQFNPDPDVITYYWIPWINLDRHPAKEPYDIPGVS